MSLSRASTLRSEGSESADACGFKIVIKQANYDALPRERTRLAASAVKAAVLAFIGAKRRALTEEAGGPGISFLQGGQNEQSSTHRVTG